MYKENKTYSMSIRVSKDELAKLKQAARLEAYASYSEFVRRTALIEASRIITKTERRKRRLVLYTKNIKIIEMLFRFSLGQWDLISD